MNRISIAIVLLAAGLAAQPLVAAAQAPAQKSAPAFSLGVAEQGSIAGTATRAQGV